MARGLTIEGLKRFAFETFRPPKIQTVSEWADENRILSRENSAENGAWRTARAPYQREIMDAFTQPGIWKIAIMACSQTGKTEILNNMMGRAIDIDPGPILYIQPTDLFAEDFSKRRIAPMIRDCEPLARKVYEAKSRDAGNTITLKTFAGGSLKIIGANSPTELAGRPVRYEFMDEIDRFPASAGAEGDPIKLAEARTVTFRLNRRVVMASTPTIKGKSNIEREYRRGTMEEYHTMCPQCGEFSFIRFDDVKFDKEERKTEDETQYAVTNPRWRCPKCRKESGEAQVRRSAGKWVKQNPGAEADGIRSFRLNPFMSPWRDWKEIAAEFLNAGKDPELLKVFHNTVLGETWEMFERNGEPEKLYARREHYDAEVPTGVTLLTMGVDTQGNRLEYEVVGWSRAEESWGIARGVIPGRPESPGVWAELDELLMREWRMKDGRGMRVLATFMDSGGLSTDAVTKECARRANRRVWAIKGEGGEGKPYVWRMKNTGAAVRFMIGVDSGKEAILHATAVEEPGPMYMHFPTDHRAGYDIEHFRQLLSERMAIRRRGGQAAIYFEMVYARNESFDIRNYARAAFKYFRWDFDTLEQTAQGITRERPAPTRDEAQARKRKMVVSPGIQV